MLSYGTPEPRLLSSHPTVVLFSKGTFCETMSRPKIFHFQLKQHVNECHFSLPQWWAVNPFNFVNTLCIVKIGYSDVKVCRSIFLGPPCIVIHVISVCILLKAKCFNLIKHECIAFIVKFRFILKNTKHILTKNRIFFCKWYQQNSWTGNGWPLRNICT